MDKRAADLVADIDAWSFGPDDDLARLDALATEYFVRPDAADHVEAWFRLYERNPEDDGNGIFWTILHGLEGQPTCAAAVVASVRRRPTEFPVLMVNRMLNDGTRSVSGVDLLTLMTAVAGDPDASAGVRKYAQRFLKHQQDKGVV